MERAFSMVKILLRQVCIFGTIYLLIAASSQGNEWEHISKGAMFLKQGKIQEAISEYEEAIKENPHLVDTYISLGYIYQYELKNNLKAIEIYLEGLKQEPDNYSLNLNIMYAYFGHGDTGKAIKHYELLSNIESKNKRYSFPKDAVYKIIQDMTKEETLDFCKKYLAMNPTDTTLREILVNIYKKERDYENAECELQAMLRYGHETSNVYFDLGACNYNLGRYKEALEFFSRAKQLGAYVPQEFFDRLHKEIEKAQ